MRLENLDRLGPARYAELPELKNAVIGKRAMTKKVATAKVCWVRKEEGGRENPPPGPRYSTPAKFDDEKDKWPHEAWSLALEFSGPPDESLCVIAKVSFLNPDGPIGLLHPGSVFELFEGYRLVARGEILEHG